VHLFNIWNENQLMSLFYSYIAGSLHISGPQAHLQESWYSCSYNHWFSFCAALFACCVCSNAFIHISTDLYMFRAHRPIFRRVYTAVHTTIGSVSVPFWSRALYVVAGLGDCSLVEKLVETSREQSPWPATTYRARDQNGTDTEPMVVWTAVRTLVKMGLWARNM